MTLPDSVALLGVKGGPAIRPGSAMPTSTLVSLGGRRVVVDCGLGVAAGLARQRMALADLDLILITHLHSDHVLELSPLIHTAWTAGLRTPVRVHGPAGLEALWQGFLASLAFDVDLRIADEGRPDLRALADIRTLDAGEVMASGGVAVSAMRVTHPPLVDCFALSFRGRRSHVVISGDTAPCDGLEAFARGADLLVHEAMLEAALPALMARVGNATDKLMAHMLHSHSFAQDAAELATRAGVKRLALNHLIPSDDPDYGPQDWREAVAAHWDGPFFVGRDGMRIEI